MNKRILLISGGLLTLIIVIAIIFIISKNNTNNEIVMQDNNKNLINNSFLTLMLEQSDGTYKESTSNTWPSGNYAFNSEMSRCENGGELEWDRELGVVKLLSNKSDGCYVYFDLYNVVEITNVNSTTTYNSITITLTTSGGENPVATYYFSIDGGNSYQESTTPSYKFSNLTMNHEYTIQVYVKDTLGYESNEEVIEVTTDNYVNPVVNSVTTTNITSNSITVSVSATNGTNNIQTYYYSINNGSYVSSSSNTYTFSGLSQGTTYNIRVYVEDSNGVDSNVYTTNAETEVMLLADFVKSLYTSQGSNGIYYHTSSLANSAGDNSYRYAGANPNNYVCFGTDASTCPSDNLYRIIGVFDGEVKLIKNTSIGSYYYSTGNNHWFTGVEYPIATTLNNTYYNNIVYIANNIWKSKISTHDFIITGMSPSNAYSNGAQVAYNYEVGANQVNVSVVSMNIGLMYVSDYYYAADTNFWTYPGYSIRGSDYGDAINSNWMYSGLDEWSITPDFSTEDRAFIIWTDGSILNSDVARRRYTRPVFYLNSNVAYISGSGTSSDPIRIN